MPHYYFHFVHDGIRLVDPEGSECAGLEAARAEAVRQIRAMVAEEMRTTGVVRLSRRIDIELADGETVTRVSFGEAIKISARPDHVP